MIYIFYAIHVVICLFLILVVLLQQGKGADLSVFGGGSTMTAFGARGAATLLHKLTVYGFIGFIVTTLAIGILQGQGQSRTVMSGVEEAAPAADQPAGDETEAAGAPAEEPTGAPAEADSAEEPTGALPADDVPLGALPADDAAPEAGETEPPPTP